MQTPFSGSLPLLQILLYTSFVVYSVQGNYLTCKATPNDASWPSISQWTTLNHTLSGRLLNVVPPASACHTSQPGSNDTCAMLKASWTTFAFHQDNPVSTAWNNMNNDSCLPDSSAPCSGLGYPIYVVNASSANDVKLAVDFARKNNVRLNIKASGHDYMKRTSAPYSLSVWTRYLVGGYEFHDGFQPKDCKTTINTTAVTVGAASYVSDLYYNLSLRNQTVVDGMGPEVTMGGYITGGGHSPISNIYGLGSDQVYEVEMVTPAGKIITANECQNEDLFWAVRGGGGGTFGILTKVTVRTVPSTPIAVYNFNLQAKANSTVYWDLVTYLLAQYPTLSAANVSAYTYLYPNMSDAKSGDQVASFEGMFALLEPDSPTVLEDMWFPFWTHVNKTYPGQITTQATSTVFPDFYSFFLKFADDSEAGVDKVVGSRLLPAEVLTDAAFGDALIQFLGESGGRLYMVSGKGVRDAEPRGGGDAVNPAWRKALMHAVTSQTWTPLDKAQQAVVEHDISNVQTEAFRQLVPDSGAYVNEAYWNEPNFQQAFWGSNYERLLQIKKVVDPNNIFWCRVCVGSEGWVELPTEGHSMSYRNALGTIMGNIFITFAISSVKVPAYVLPRKIRHVLEAIKEFRSYMAEVVGTERKSYANGEGPRNSNLMASMIGASEDAGKEAKSEDKARFTLTDEEMWGNLFIYNVAGHETTAKTLAYAVGVLACHPAWQDWLKEELDNFFGSKEVGRDQYQEAYPLLKRCLAMMYETLRLYAPLNGIPRYTGNLHQQLQIGADSYTIPPHTAIFLNNAATHCDERYWGPDKLVWRPNRWIVRTGGTANAEEAFIQPAEGAYIPWASGPRVCPGKKLSQVEFVAAIACLMHQHRVVPVMGRGETEQQARERLMLVMADSDMTLAKKSNRPEKLSVKWHRR